MGNGYNHKEVRADRVSFFFTELEKGTHTISYLARITTGGILSICRLKIGRCMTSQSGEDHQAQF